MSTINKAPELLLAGEILELFNTDCLNTSKTKYTPFPLLEKMLSVYCEYLGVRVPSSKQLGTYLTSRYPKQVTAGFTAYQLAIRPEVIQKETPG